MLRTVGVAMDITERKLAEEKLRAAEEKMRQSHKMEVVGRMAGAIAHDVNNLLTAVSGYSEILLGRLEKKDPSRHYVEEIKKAGDHAGAVARQLKAFSRKQVPAPSVLSLNDILADLQKLIRRLLGEGISLKLECAENLPTIEADAGQVGQVLMNLLFNARDAMPAGGGLTIATFDAVVDKAMGDFILEPAPGTYACLQVKDTGCGMGREVLSHLGQPFFTTKDNSHAMGLGLATVYGILSQYGGGIRVESEEGKGSTFQIFFAKTGVDWAAVQEAVPQLRGSASERETILLVEDDESIRKLVKQVLTAEGYRLLEASGARDALRVHEQHRDEIRLLLTDVVMPGISGRELAKTLHDLWPDLKIIFMSGFTDDDTLRKGLESAQARFLGKPFTPSQLLEMVREALQAHPKSSAAQGSKGF
jgi:two-component system, cell cycle sensor histidine kinase and response regulator CckA